MLARVQGQTDAVRVLQRVVSGDLRNALLLVGPEGVGRRFSIVETARETFAQDGLGETHDFQINKGVHPDLIFVQPEDDKALGIEAIRGLIQATSFLPTMAARRFVVLEGVDAMTVPAGNAFLKTLEEPPTNTQFFLLAQSLSQVLPTIQSRCGLVRFNRLPEAFIVAQLSQQIDDPVKALVYSRLSEGSVGRAFQLLGSGRLSLRDDFVGLLRRGLTKDLASILSAVGDPAELRQGLIFLEHILHDLIMIHHVPQRISNLDISEDLRVLSNSLGTDRVYRLLGGLKALRRLDGTAANLMFHVKTLLVTTFGQ